MSVSTKTLIISETLFQDQVILDIDVISSKEMTILDYLNANNVSINQSCGGSGSCGTCRLLIMNPSDFILPENDFEKMAAVDLNLKLNQRLACQTEINKKSKCSLIEIIIVNEFIN